MLTVWKICESGKLEVLPRVLGAFASKREIFSRGSTLVGVGECIIKMYKFGQIEIASKEFNSVYQIQKDIDLEKIRVCEGVVANKHDTRYSAVREYLEESRRALEAGVGGSAAEQRQVCQSEADHLGR